MLELHHERVEAHSLQLQASSDERTVEVDYDHFAMSQT